MKKKYQVFISSTLTDLIEERTVVRDAILKIHQFPVGMEQFNAEDSEQWDVIKDSIDLSDYYVLILGKRYGSVITSGEDAGISYTEKEFNYAVSQGVPVLVFIKSDNATFKGTSFETDADKIRKLDIFKEKVKTGRIVEWFDSSYQLASQVMAALHNEMEKGNRPGWIRGNQTDIEAKVDQLIALLKDEFDIGYEKENEDDNWDEPVTDYEFMSPRFPSDGKHKEMGRNGAPIGEGMYMDHELIEGIEYDVLVHITKGKLNFKPDCPEDPYDFSDDFEYERMESYGWGLSFMPFGMSEQYITEDGLDQYYVVDFEVAKKTEQMINIRTLEEFLKEKNPKHLEYLKELIAIKKQ